MKLSVLDRIIIVKSLLPETGTIEQIKLIMSLKDKLGFSNEELKVFNISVPSRGILEISNITLEMKERTGSYDITIQELEMLRQFSNSFNVNGWITEHSLDTIEYLLNYTLEE